MSLALRDLWLVLKKELLSCFRDQDVLIYGLLFPLLLYPLAIVAVSEVFTWYMGMTEQHKTKIVLVYDDPPPSPFIEDALKDSKSIQIVQSKNPLEDLHSGALDAIVHYSNVRRTVEIQIDNSKDQLGTPAWLVESAIRTKRFESLKHMLVQKGLNDKYLRVFHAKAESVTPGVKGPETIPFGQNELKIAFTLLLAVVVTQMAIVSAAAATCMLADEREKKTFFTTMLLPISRMRLMTGKFLAVVIVTMLSCVVNFCSMSLAPLELILALPKAKIDWSQVFHQVGLPHISEVLSTSLILLLSAAFFSSCYLCVTAFARSFKEAQTLLTIPMLVLMLLPVAGSLPVLELGHGTALIPVLNLFVLRKTHQPNPIYSAVVFIEIVALTWLFLWLASRIFLRDLGNQKRPKTVKGAAT